MPAGTPAGAARARHDSRLARTAILRRERGWSLALQCAVVLPAIVALVRVLGRGYLPIGDQALEAVTVLDLLGGNLPLTGAATDAGHGIRHPGPLLSYLLAPGVLLTGGSLTGILIAFAVLSAVCALAALGIARAVGGTLLATVVVVASVLTVWVVGPEVLVVALHPNLLAASVPLLFVLTWAVVLGRTDLLPWWVVVHALVVQPDWWGVPLGAIWLVVVVIALLGRRGRARSTGRHGGGSPHPAPAASRPVLRALAVAAAVWLPTVVDLVLHRGQSTVGRLFGAVLGGGGLGREGDTDPAPVLRGLLRLFAPWPGNRGAAVGEGGLTLGQLAQPPWPVVDAVLVVLLLAALALLPRLLSGRGTVLGGIAETGALVLLAGIVGLGATFVAVPSTALASEGAALAVLTLAHLTWALVGALGVALVVTLTRARRGGVAARRPGAASAQATLSSQLALATGIALCAVAVLATGTSRLARTLTPPESLASAMPAITAAVERALPDRTRPVDILGTTVEAERDLGWGVGAALLGAGVDARLSPPAAEALANPARGLTGDSRRALRVVIAEAGTGGSLVSDEYTSVATLSTGRGTLAFVYVIDPQP